MSQGTLAPVVIEAEHLQLVDGKFTFPGDDQHDALSLDDSFLLLESTRSPEKQTICLLKEDMGESDNPWKLVFLRVNRSGLPNGVRSRHSPLGELPPHLLPGEGRRVDIIVSTKSGTDKALIFWETVFQPLLRVVCDELGASSTLGTFQENVLITENADSVSHFAKGLVSSEPKERTVVLLSGDGGVVDLLNAADAEDMSLPFPPIIALLPLGTGNALFHSMHKPAYSLQPLPPLAWGLRTLFLGTDVSLPAFQASFPPGSHIIPPGATQPPNRPVSNLRGVVVASYGFHASIVYESDTPEHRVQGAKRFAMVAQELLEESHLYEARVSLLRAGGADGGALKSVARDTHAYVLTTLVSNLEQAFVISPASRPLDGKLRTIHFGPLGGERTMEAMKAAYDGGKHVDLVWDDGERIEYDEVEEVEMEILDEDERWRKVCIDGTIVGVPKGGKVTIQNIPQSPFRILISREALRQD